jgi:peptide/nickel transport system permease protein
MDCATRSTRDSGSNDPLCDLAHPPTPEWGSMIGQERNQVFTAPHLIFFPGIALILTVLAFNLLGDGLRDALDPRQRHA